MESKTGSATIPILVSVSMVLRTTWPSVHTRSYPSHLRLLTHGCLLAISLVMTLGAGQLCECFVRLEISRCSCLRSTDGAMRTRIQLVGGRLLLLYIVISHHALTASRGTSGMW